MKLSNSYIFVLSVIILTFFSTIVFSQTPEKMSYQAVIRDGSNNLVVNSSISMQISILQSGANGNSVYVETQNENTNENGLLSIEIGNGNFVSGNFETIDWSNGPYFIKTETDPTGGTNYTISGTSQLLSVPFALYAKSSGSSTPGPQGETGPQGPAGVDGTGTTQTLSQSGNDITLSDGGGSVTINDNDTQLDEAGVIALGFTTGAHTADTNTQLDEAAVDAFVDNNGYLSTEADGSTTNEIQDLQLSGNNLTITNNGTATTIDLTPYLDNIDTQLTEAEVDVFANNNGYLTTEVDGSTTNEIQDLSQVLAQNNDGAGNQIKNVADPSNVQDVATKGYVDLLESTILTLQSSIIDLEVTLNSYIKTWYEDIDGDGFGDTSSSIKEIANQNGYVLQDGDCDINVSEAYPGAPEIVDGIDNNCDGNIDEAICGDGIVQPGEDCDGTPGCTMLCDYEDIDGDGYNSSIDCDDNSSFIYPGAPEYVDGIDNDCDGQIDEATCGDNIVQPGEYCDGTPGCTLSCTLDLDGDGYDNTIDCDNNNPDVYPGAPELVDGIDNNCNGQTDEAICGDGIVQPGEDCDGDGYDSIQDCNDNDPTISPGALELVDGKDNDCDGSIDEATCGDGIVQPSEQCDDGNNINGDGCENCLITIIH